ncbi:MAG: hypothetical protein U0270_36860 [Labilithrix sp.]
MRWLAGLVAMVAMVGCAAAPAEDEASSGSAAAASETPANEPIARSEIPQAQAFKGWRDNDSMTDKPRPEDATRVPLACTDKHLYPTHPSSDRKRYHRVAVGSFDQFKVDGDSNVCKIKGNGTSPQTGLRRCAAADTLQYIVLSDTFEDGCGNLYRGFWAVSFLTMDENMGTLMSLGRTVYQDPHSEFKGDMYDAQTYAIDEEQLLVLSSLFDGDAEAITRGRKAVTDAKTHAYDAQTHLWQYVGPNR